MSRMITRQSSTKAVGRTFFLLALTFTCSVLTASFASAEVGGQKASTKPRWQSVAQNQAKKRAAASLLGSPMQAKYDDYRPTSRDSSPSTAPNFRSARAARCKQLLKEGSRHHSSGNLQEADRCFREAVVLDPRNADCFYNLGALAEGRGDFIDALTQYRAGLAMLPQDKSLLEAVEAMETRLTSGDSKDLAQRRPSSFSYPPRMFTAPAYDPPVLGVRPSDVPTYDPPVLGVRQSDAPILEQAQDRPPLLPVDSNGPFQLQTSQNSAMGNTGSGALNSGLSIVNSRPPVVGVQQPAFRRRATGAAFSTILNVGLSTALRGSGLHCPACRFLRF